MVYFIEHKNFKGVPKSAAFVSAFFDAHARDIYEFIVKILDEDIVTVTEVPDIGEAGSTMYVEINRFDEFVKYSPEWFEPKKGGQIKEIFVEDQITNVYQITKNT